MSFTIKSKRRPNSEAKIKKSSESPQSAASTAFKPGLIDRSLPEFRAALIKWFRENARALPWRTPSPRDPYAVLVSEMMLQQTQVVTVIDYYNRWLVRFPDIAALAAADEQDVLHAWQGLGYYSRARNLHRAAQKIVAEHGGVFPREFALVLELPGVGRYTAGAVATFAFDQPEPPVDGNIARVLARLFNSWETVDAAAVLERIRQTVARWQPETQAGQFNEALMELGALVCTPRAPACLACPVRTFCTAQQPELLPVKKPRQKTVRLVENCAWVVRACGTERHAPPGAMEVLLEQQTGKRWRGLWRLPLLTEPRPSTPLVTLEYPFTHHRITLAAFPASIPLIMAENQRWFAVESLAEAAMPSPHRRALKQLMKTL